MTTTFKKTILYFLDLFYLPFKKLLPYNLYAYLGVGALNTALNIVLFVFLYQVVLPIQGVVLAGYVVACYTLALIIAFALTVPTGFWLNKNFAFSQTEVIPIKTNMQQVKYLVVVLQGLAMDYLILKALVLYAGLNPSVAKIISTCTVLTLNYLLQKYYTFKVKPHNFIIRD